MHLFSVVYTPFGRSALFVSVFSAQSFLGLSGKEDNLTINTCCYQNGCNSILGFSVLQDAKSDTFHILSCENLIRVHFGHIEYYSAPCDNAVLVVLFSHPLILHLFQFGVLLL